MKPNQQIYDFIMHEEGFRNRAYKPLPTDRYTIGYGSTFYENGDPVCEGDIITIEEAKSLLKLKVDNLALKLSTITNPNCKQNQFDAVLSLCYNIGYTKFKESMTGELYYRGVNIANRFALWNKSGGKIIKGLSNRRLKERIIYETGVYMDI